MRLPSGNSKLCHQPFSERSAFQSLTYSKPAGGVGTSLTRSRYSLTIFGEATPFKALRVSTINAARSTIFR
jgi:hypothetical protein